MAQWVNCLVQVWGQEIGLPGSAYRRPAVISVWEAEMGSPEQAVNEVHQNSKLWGYVKTLSQSPRWRVMEEDTRHQPLASTCIHIPTNPCTCKHAYIPACTPHTHTHTLDSVTLVSHCRGYQLVNVKMMTSSLARGSIGVPDFALSLLFFSEDESHMASRILKAGLRISLQHSFLSFPKQNPCTHACQQALWQQHYFYAVTPLLVQGIFPQNR